MSQIIHEELSNKVLGMEFTVHNILGPGLPEFSDPVKQLGNLPVIAYLFTTFCNICNNSKLWFWNIHVLSAIDGMMKN